MISCICICYVFRLTKTFLHISYIICTSGATFKPNYIHWLHTLECYCRYFHTPSGWWNSFMLYILKGIIQRYLNEFIVRWSGETVGGWVRGFALYTVKGGAIWYAGWHHQIRGCLYLYLSASCFFCSLPCGLFILTCVFVCICPLLYIMH